MWSVCACRPYHTGRGGRGQMQAAMHNMPHTHPRKHVVHISLINAFSHKQEFDMYTNHMHTWACPQFPLQSDIKAYSEGSCPQLFIWLNGCHWGTRSHHTTSLHQQTAICPYHWLSILSGGHQLSWLGHSLNPIFSFLVECLNFCCLLKCWL